MGIITRCECINNDVEVTIFFKVSYKSQKDSTGDVHRSQADQVSKKNVQSLSFGKLVFILYCWSFISFIKNLIVEVELVLILAS